MEFSASICFPDPYPRGSVSIREPPPFRRIYDCTGRNFPFRKTGIGWKIGLISDRRLRQPPIRLRKRRTLLFFLPCLLPSRDQALPTISFRCNPAIEAVGSLVANPL